jgi:hypothetical protein
LSDDVYSSDAFGNGRCCKENTHYHNSNDSLDTYDSDDADGRENHYGSNNNVYTAYACTPEFLIFHQDVQAE